MYKVELTYGHCSIRFWGQEAAERLSSGAANGKHDKHENSCNIGKQAHVLTASNGQVERQIVSKLFWPSTRAEKLIVFEWYFPTEVPKMSHSKNVSGLLPHRSEF